MSKTYTKILLNFFEITFVITGITMVCYLLLGQMLEITGDSMLPLLHDKERILAEKVSSKFSDYKPGDVVVFTSPAEKNRLVIKRIIGVYGDKVSVINGKVTINGKELEQTELNTIGGYDTWEYLKEGKTLTIPEDEYFVLGDNRAESVDSRYFGLVTKDLILGRALFVYKPISEFKFIN